MIVQVKNLTIGFDDKIIIENLNFDVNRGEKVSIVGKSGRGKTSLLNALLGFVEIQKGDINILGKNLNIKNIREIRSKISWLPQEVNLQLNTVKELFYIPFQFTVNKNNTPSEDEINSVFNKIDLEIDILTKSINEISGGQKQRIAIASCFLLKKPILILDEPSSALDSKVIELLIDFLFSQKDLTIISSSHNELWINRSDKIINL
ncbi:MAG: ATP-binding cassette domain-containing protein [Bacteroidetes bacterium]|jgi:putative ABC transport system ATP-binding protein|nr:ATP-binding cassette domain-containing protein [Bacteroidota bacterium]MBT6686186.1 ATP-binding cassette domain-containing protein [Bacteroidota bacterium]MBT7143897.1 ATP-binding cassette domain-containing protein [Bacteroidota bacterium]MBT7491252.1 ATP-binding cassette domain-containing protein [Bacteroidota bacterium]